MERFGYLEEGVEYFEREGERSMEVVNRWGGFD